MRRKRARSRGPSTGTTTSSDARSSPTDGATVGDVVDVLHAGANDVLVIRGDANSEHLVPLVSDFVKHVEPGVRIEIEPIPGLLE